MRLNTIESPVLFIDLPLILECFQHKVREISSLFQQQCTGQAQDWGETSSLDEDESRPKDITFKVTKERIGQNIKNKAHCTGTLSTDYASHWNTS